MVKFVPLGSLIAPVRSKRAGQDKYPVLSITRDDGLVFQSSRFKKRIAGADLSNYKIIDKGQLVVGFPIDEAVIDFQTICEAGIVSPAYGVWKLLDEQRVDMEYLRKYLRSDSAVAQYKLRLRGTTARRRSLTKEAFQSIQIPLPPLEEQRRIAAILDEMGALIEKVDSELSVLQKVQHSGLDEVLRRSPQVPLKTYVDSIQSGKSVKEASTDEVCNRVLKISAVTSGIFEPGESKPLPDDYTPADAHRVQKGDVLVSRANTAELVGASALVVDEVQNLYLPDKLWRLNLAQGAQAAVIVGILQNAVVRSRISAKASGSGGSMKNITQSAFLQVLVPQLSTGEQARLSSLLMLFGSVRELLHQKRLLLEDLRLSLSTRAFQGGL